VFARGVPPEERNGLFGLEEELMNSTETRVTAIVTYSVSEIVAKEMAGERYPVLKIEHIEPVRSERGIAAAKKLQREAHKARTGANQLPLEIEGESEEDET
jgi:hypothetical protein